MSKKIGVVLGLILCFCSFAAFADAKSDVTEKADMLNTALKEQVDKYLDPFQAVILPKAKGRLHADKHHFEYRILKPIYHIFEIGYSQYEVLTAEYFRGSEKWNVYLIPFYYVDSVKYHALVSELTGWSSKNGIMVKKDEDRYLAIQPGYNYNGKEYYVVVSSKAFNVDEMLTKWKKGFHDVGLPWNHD